MLDLLMKLSPEILYVSLAYILMTVLAILAVAPRATYWILLIVVFLALYLAGWKVEYVAITVLFFVTWWFIGSSRNAPSTQIKEG